MTGLAKQVCQLHPEGCRTIGQHSGDAEVDLALAWSRRLLKLEEELRQATQFYHDSQAWLRAYDAFILADGKIKSSREAVRAFYSKKGYGLP